MKSKFILQQHFYYVRCLFFLATLYNSIAKRKKKEVCFRFLYCSLLSFSQPQTLKLNEMDVINNRTTQNTNNKCQI